MVAPFPEENVERVIAEVGADTPGFAIGDPVLALPGFGGYADRLIIDAGKVFGVPNTLSAGQAAGFVQSYCTALFALRDRGRLQAGETLLVLGAAGGVGRAAIDIGKALGARIIAAASSDERLADCRALGADDAINYEVDLKDSLFTLSNLRNPRD